MNLVGIVLFRHAEEKSRQKKLRRRRQHDLEMQLIRDLRNSHKQKKLDKDSRTRGFSTRREELSALAEAERMNEAHDRALRVEATMCPKHFPPSHAENPAMRYLKDDCPVCESESTDITSVVEVATALLAGGESNSDVATYLSGETGIPHAEAIRILMGIKGKLAVQAAHSDSE